MKIYQEAFLRLLFPENCGLCDAPLDIYERGLCPNCSRAVRNLCFGPEEMLFSKSWEFLDHAWALYPYVSPVREVLTAVKFEHKRWLLRVFRKDLDRLTSIAMGGISYDFLVPIPMGRRRLTERGFNQSEILAGWISKVSNVPVKTGYLRKNPGVLAQNPLGREERLANPWGAFKLCGRLNWAGQNVLLVDDILTTGATCEEAARIFKEAGARHVDVITLARTPLYEGN